jgi:hypothetical protein
MTIEIKIFKSIIKELKDIGFENTKEDPFKFYVRINNECVSLSMNPEECQTIIKWLKGFEER